MSDTNGPRRAAQQMQEAARYLARAARNLDAPSDSHEILRSLQETQGSIAQTIRELAQWHRAAAAGTHYSRPHNESARGVMTAVSELDLAAQEADALQETLNRAHGGSSVVDWLETPDAEATEPETQEPEKPRND
ncbi:MULTISPECIES: hypothetical protein [unclassified Arthrobacter]|uniref:hypothetical protein n=1 Tax=unclassified Arthrobacter TaxID=235627 RepID=UPI0011B08F48|nr:MULTISPECIES: hypothetical protein [unclassified Arthrobacter]MBT2534668.1 hypothetical protein [Arthrobacter sp. ISL-69]